MLLKVDLKALKDVARHWRGVGVLLEVPVTLLAVDVVNRSHAWYERRSGVPSHEECCPVGRLQAGR